MKTSRYLFYLTIIFCLTACNPSISPPAEPFSILFIGDSTTSRNDLPNVFAALAESRGHQVFVDSATKDGTSLAMHTRTPATSNKLESQSWTYIVLQESERIAAVTEDSQAYSLPMIELFHNLTTEQGGTNFLYLPFGYRDGYGEFENYTLMQSALNKNQLEIAQSLGIPIMPVGIVWQEVHASNPEIELWQKDGEHTSPAGAYLAACVFYTIVFQESPIGLPIPETIAISADAAAIIQEITNQIVYEDLSYWLNP